MLQVLPAWSPWRLEWSSAISDTSDGSRSPSEAESVSSTRAHQMSKPAVPGPLAGPAPAGLPTAPASSLAPPVQSKLLRQINAYQTKEELLSFVASCISLLDPINLVTCIYRLARMYSSIRAVEVRSIWKNELVGHPTFQLLLRTVQSHLLQAQLQLLSHEEVRGLDARCVSNLIWAAVKLEVACEAGGLGTELVLTASPLVLFFLDQSSCQGLANLLWSYSKMEVPPLDVMMSIVRQMTDLLAQPASAASFDAQALSNSVWALAHIRASTAELDLVAGQVGCVQAFLEGVATAAGRMLSQFSPQLNVSQLQAYMFDREKRFSCQALVNIAWGFATMMGEVCAANPLFRQLFLQIRQEAIMRLHATSSGLQLNQAWVHRIVGGLNPQALSNMTFAYDKVGMLDRELLQWIFNVAALRLARIDPGMGPLEFKAQELCTLMRAAHLGIAQPWAFLSRLDAIVATRPQMLATWTPAELAELDRALLLLHQFKVPLQQSGQVQGQQMLMQAPALSMNAGVPGGLSHQQLLLLAQQNQQAVQHQQQQHALVLAQAHVAQQQEQVATQLQLMQLNLGFQQQQKQQQKQQQQQQQQQRQQQQQQGQAQQQMMAAAANGLMAPLLVVSSGQAGAQQAVLQQGWVLPDGLLTLSDSSLLDSGSMDGQPMPPKSYLQLAVESSSSAMSGNTSLPALQASSSAPGSRAGSGSNVAARNLFLSLTGSSAQATDSAAMHADGSMRLLAHNAAQQVPTAPSSGSILANAQHSFLIPSTGGQGPR